MLQKIILTNPRGFCAGVSRAIKIVEQAIIKYGTPLYVRHQIVHNEYVVENLEKQGVIFIEKLSEIPDESVLILSAHGTAPEIIQSAKNRNLKILDATCPLVTKVHIEARQHHAKNHQIVLIGHHGHQEVIGIMGEAPMQLIQNLNDINKLQLNPNKNIICLTQTTLSQDDTVKLITALKEKYPRLITPSGQDICYATQNRQNAVKKLATKVSLILVIGSKNSSNSKRLVETAQKYGCASWLVTNVDSLNISEISKHQVIGITSGASVPEDLEQKIIKYLQKIYHPLQITTDSGISENINFPLFNT